LRNPLAEPFILGVSGGASLGAALAIATGLAALSGLFVPAFSFAGAVLVLAAVLRMACGGGAGYASNIALSGVVAGSVCSSVLMFIVSVSGSHEMNSITWWMLGSLQPASQWLLWGMLALTLAGCAAFFAFGRETDAMTLGSETAFHLGVSPRLLLGVLLGIASLLTALSVALSGIIGFVGLVVPHLLRRLFGAGHRRLFPLSLLCGGIFLMLCDTLARTVMGSMELPVGVISSFIGGPFFLWVLNARRIKE
jgi:iron complex transport system permease protein